MREWRLHARWRTTRPGGALPRAASREGHARRAPRRRTSARPSCIASSIARALVASPVGGTSTRSSTPPPRWSATSVAPAAGKAARTCARSQLVGHRPGRRGARAGTPRTRVTTPPSCSRSSAGGNAAGELRARLASASGTRADTSTRATGSRDDDRHVEGDGKPTAPGASMATRTSCPRPSGAASAWSSGPHAERVVRAHHPPWPARPPARCGRPSRPGHDGVRAEHVRTVIERLGARGPRGGARRPRARRCRACGGAARPRTDSANSTPSAPARSRERGEPRDTIARSSARPSIAKARAA
jgi:hypothetical protein